MIWPATVISDNSSPWEASSAKHLICTTVVPRPRTCTYLLATTWLAESAKQTLCMTSPVGMIEGHRLACKH